MKKRLLIFRTDAEIELFTVFKSYVIKINLVDTCLGQSLQWLRLFGGVFPCSLSRQWVKYTHMHTDTQRKLAEEHKIKHLFKNVI